MVIGDLEDSEECHVPMIDADDDDMMSMAPCGSHRGAGRPTVAAPLSLKGFVVGCGPVLAAVRLPWAVQRGRGWRGRSGDSLRSQGSSLRVPPARSTPPWAENI